jgi:KDO2-lipid IV(A) lauroyltransferase
MAKFKGSSLPMAVQIPLAAGVRLALAAPTLVGLTTMSELAGRLGRRFGAMPFNHKRLARADENLREVYPDWPAERRREHALDAYAHIFRLGIEFAFMPRILSTDSWHRHLSLGSLGAAVEKLVGSRPCILISGHVGNWELIGAAVAMLGFPLHAVYRPLDLAPLDRWVRESRSRQGLTMVSKFGAVHDLPKCLKEGRPIGLVADQNGGDRGVFVPCFGRLTSTYKSIGLMALQHDATLVCGYARREAGSGGVGCRGGGGGGGLGYVMETVDAFGPEEYRSQPDPLFYLTARYRRAMETMIRRSPDQYLWMHRIWRSRPPHERTGKPFPEALKDKLRALPWMSEPELQRIVERSERDRHLATGIGP